jgi:hypothetical protein
MKIFKYQDEKHYRKVQTEGNILKLDWVWIKESDIDYMSRVIKFDPKLILCHGSRNGAEIKYWNNRYPNAKVFGTEISATARSFPNTIRHDFQKPHGFFTGKCDIIYSNSFDHTYNPEKTLNVWKDQLNKRGLLFIELAWDINNSSSELDPLELDSEEEWYNLTLSCGLNCKSVMSRYKLDSNMKTGAIYLCTRME